MLPTDIGAEITGELVLDPATIIAAAGNDGVAVNGRILDLLALARKYTSAKLIIFWKTTLGAAETLSITAKLQHGAAANLSDAADYTYAPDGDSPSLAATVVKTGVATAAYGRTELPFDLSGAKQYIRPTVTANLSAGATDTVLIGAVLVLGGAHATPAA